MWKKPSTFRDLLDMPGIFLGLAAFLAFIVGVWERWASIIYLSLVMGASSLLSLGFLVSPTLKKILPISGISTVLGFLLVIKAIGILGWPDKWVPWTLAISGLISLFAACCDLFLKKEAPKPQPE